MSSSILRGHALESLDPLLAALLETTIKQCIAPNTISTYNSAVSSWTKFCATYDVEPFPAQPIWLAAWMTSKALYIKISSLKTYKSAVRHAHVERGLDWDLSYTQIPRLTMRGLKRKYGDPSTRLKVPISVVLIHKMARCLPGWPWPDKMKHNDILFVCASLIGTLGFLRGGEFLYSKYSARPTLLRSDVQIKEISGTRVLELAIRAPKARPFEGAAIVRLFEDIEQPLLCPVRWFQLYEASAGSMLKPNIGVFRKQDKTILSKDDMLQRSLDLLEQADVHFHDMDGRIITPKASSWRAGGVQSAADAKIGEDAIRRCGRWASSAWLKYRYVKVSDTKRAARQMMRAANSMMQEEYAQSTQVECIWSSGELVGF